MKKLLLGTVALAALGASANAADMRARPLVAAAVPYTTWTGCHVGGAVGNEWGTSGGFSTTAARYNLVSPQLQFLLVRFSATLTWTASSGAFTAAAITRREHGFSE